MSASPMHQSPRFLLSFLSLLLLTSFSSMFCNCDESDGGTQQLVANFNLDRQAWSSIQLERFAQYAGFSDEQIKAMEEAQVSIYLAAANVLAAQSHTRAAAKLNGENEMLGAEPVLFYIELDIGTPPQKFRLQLDTGSSTLAIPDSSCSNCATHCNYPYSSTGSRVSVSCDSDVCCGQSQCPSSVCAPQPQDAQCGFSIQYMDGSKVSGMWVRDLVTIANYSSVPLYFGAILDSSASFEPYEVDGIVGVSMKQLNTNSGGDTFNTIIDQLNSSLGLPKIFSICFGSNGGSMMFGGVDSDHMATPPLYTAFDPSSGFYLVQVDSLTMDTNSATTTVSGSHFCVIDSGTTLWYVPRPVKDAIALQIRNQACSSSSSNQNLCTEVNALLGGYCVAISTQSLSQLPNITVVFPEGHHINVTATTYMRLGLCSSGSQRAFGIAAFDTSKPDCGSFDNPCIYGDTMMLAQAWVFDQDNLQIGFASQLNCNPAKLNSNNSVCPRPNVPLNVTSAAASSKPFYATCALFSVTSLLYLLGL